MSKVYVFGSLNMDLVISSPYVPQAGETMFGSGFFTSPGGKGANQAAACGKLGGDIRMGGAVGGDGFGRELLEGLGSYGVNTDAIQVLEGCSTGIAVILVIDSDNRIILDGGANMQVTTAHVDALLADAAPGDIFLCPLENPLEVIGYALTQAKEKGMYVILNPAPMNTAIACWLDRCSMLILNETEFAALCGQDLEAGAQKLLDLGLEEVILTLGSKGYARITREGIEEFPCMKVKAVDTTAAGDTFCGALAVKLSQGCSVPDAAAYANRAAALTVTRKGAQQAIPTWQEVEG